MKNHLLTGSAWLLLALTLTLSACTSTMTASTNNDVQALADKSHALATKHAKMPDVETVQPPVRFVRKLYLPLQDGSALSSQQLSNKTLTRKLAVGQYFESLPALAGHLATLTEVQVTIAADAAPGATPSGNKGAIARPANSAPDSAPQAGITMKYNGTVGGFLDAVAAAYGISWEWSANRIHFFRHATKTFKIVALPGDTAMQAQVSNSVGSGSASGATPGAAGSSGPSTVSGASSSTGITYAGLSVWSALEASIKPMLSSGGSVTVTPATASITVTDTPQNITRIATFIDAQNASLSLQVVVNVKVLSVDLTDSNEFGINLGALYNSLSGNYGLALSNTFTAGTGASNLALRVLGTPGTGVPGNGSVKAWQGSQAIISALAQQGRVSQLTSAALMTLNNQATPLQVGTQTAFLASSATTLTASVGATTTLTPGTFSTGFAMTVLPNILDSNTLILQTTMNVSSLIALTQASSNGSSIQTPSLATRNVLQRVRINSGDTLVITGFEQESNNSDSQGVGNPSNIALGGGANYAKKRSTLVILIQPIIGNN